MNYFVSKKLLVSSLAALTLVGGASLASAQGVSGGASGSVDVGGYTNIYPGEGTVCTMDAMQCPDGSWVGRSGPNCAFICPSMGEPYPPSNRVDFSATPLSGSAPLTVNFRASLVDPQHYKVEFGDGTVGRFDICAESYPARCSISHTYRANGTYTATLVYDRCPPTAGTSCLSPVEIQGSLEVQVGARGSWDDNPIPPPGDTGSGDGVGYSGGTSGSIPGAHIQTNIHVDGPAEVEGTKDSWFRAILRFFFGFE